MKKNGQKTGNVLLEVWLRLAELKDLLAVCERGMEPECVITVQEAESVIKICRRMVEELVVCLDKEVDGSTVGYQDIRG